MYDTSFDDSRSPRTDRTVLWTLRVAGLIATIAVASADAQIPGAPVLQNAWATPGIVGAVNYGGALYGSGIAAAGGWTPTSGRFQVSGGIGSRSLTGHGSGFAYGARAALPIYGGGASAIGVA